MRQTLPILALLLLFGFAPGSTLAGSRPRSGIHMIGDRRAPVREPYLIAVGAPALRFREPETASEPAARSVVVGPPVPGLNADEAVVAVANAAAVRVPSVREAKPDSVNAPKSGPALSIPRKPIPLSILPDDTRPQVRAEDFLPFFQIPGAAQGGDAPAAFAPQSAPGALPPSSATYTQTPK